MNDGMVVLSPEEVEFNGTVTSKMLQLLKDIPDYRERYGINKRYGSLRRMPPLVDPRTRVLRPSQKETQLSPRRLKRRSTSACRFNGKRIERR